MKRPIDFAERIVKLLTVTDETLGRLILFRAFMHIEHPEVILIRFTEGAGTVAIGSSSTASFDQDNPDGVSLDYRHPGFNA